MMAQPIQTAHLRFYLLPYESLLDGLERTGHAIEYQCRSGYCGACRLTLDQGSVTYLTEPLAYVAADEVLPCCCVPNTPIQLACGLHLALDQPVEQPLDQALEQTLEQVMTEDSAPFQHMLFDAPITMGVDQPFKQSRTRRVRALTAHTHNLSLFI